MSPLEKKTGYLFIEVRLKANSPNGDYEELLKKYGLRPGDIVYAIEKVNDKVLRCVVIGEKLAALTDPEGIDNFLYFTMDEVEFL